MPIESTGKAHLQFLNIEGLAGKAPLYVTIFKNQKEWDQERGTEMEPIAVMQKEAMVENLLFQNYAFSAYVDLNGNGKLDTNAFGVPREPWALSQLGAKTPMGKPAWSAIRVEVKTGTVAHVPLYFHR